MTTTTLTHEQRLHFFDHNNHKIMWCDYSKSSEQEMISLLIKAVNLGKTSGNKLNILSDFSSTPKCPEFNKLLKGYGKEFYEDSVSVRVAILGIDSTLKRVVVNATMAITRIKNVKLFETRENAIEWLIS
ncbi:hypothetical protein [Ekhidna sp.]|uniref:hypothetical protein n=1 Tax=Ekhidna sp. TaxID=2608089 RepID=UPI003298C7DB